MPKIRAKQMKKEKRKKENEAMKKRGHRGASTMMQTARSKPIKPSKKTTQKAKDDMSVRKKKNKDKRDKGRKRSGSVSRADRRKKAPRARASDAILVAKQKREIHKKYKKKCECRRVEKYIEGFEEFTRIVT
eukprot:429316_1